MGRIVASYQVRIHLKENPQQTVEQFLGLGGDDPVPTNSDLQRLIERMIYDQLPYWPVFGISVEVERLDK